ncbi:hypothetical protein RKD49_007340 [Streptomyces glaucescens]
MSGTDRNRNPVARARAVLPAGETPRGEHRVTLAARAPVPGRFRRPRALRSERRTLHSWLMLPVEAVARLMTITWNPVDAFFEAVFWRDAKRPGKPFHGGWNSMAGRLARAVVPRTRNGAHVVMQVTGHHLRLAYVSSARTLTGAPGAVELGWYTDLRDVTWIRDRSDVVGGNHEIGFVDGSWCSVHFVGDGWSRMPDAFPLRLSHLDAIPTAR